MVINTPVFRNLGSILYSYYYACPYVIGLFGTYGDSVNPWQAIEDLRRGKSRQTDRYYSSHELVQHRLAKIFLLA